MREFYARQKLKNRGFTLIELLVVIAIIGVLASMVLVSVTDVRAKARDARRKSDITQIGKALELYYVANSTYPVRAWTLSNNATNWGAFRTSLASYINIPIDPVNSVVSGTYPWSDRGNYIYAYYASGYGCSGGWYMISYRLEKPDIISPGVYSCPYTGYPNGYYFNYGSTNVSSTAYGTITVGMRQQ